VALPKWNDPELKAGTMIRTALWLIAEVGEGNTFTKEQHRDAFPGVAQADRRMRDLRDFGWVIHTSAEDASLKPEEQRFVTAGLAVWEPGVRGSAAGKAITAKQRQATFAADGYQCTVCGIAGGEAYPDAPYESAVLSVTRRESERPDGEKEVALITECKRCRSGASAAAAVSATRLLADLKALDPADRDRLARWVERGRRGATPLDRVWTAYRRLSAHERAEIAQYLAN
jgi:hypothetical protein